MHGIMDGRSTWTDEEVAYLKANAGRMSAGQMGRALGRSRNAVLGKADRLGVHMGAPGRNEKPAEPPPPPPRPTRREITLARQQGSTETDAEDPPARVVAEEGEGQPAGSLDGFGGVTLLDLGDHHCRWPLAGGFYCGEARVDFRYCAEHARVNRRGPADAALARPKGLKPGRLVARRVML